MKNPFSSPLSLARSHYCRMLDGELYIPAEENVDSDLTQEIHRRLQEMIVEQDYTCVAAQAAFNQESYRFGIYPSLASDAGTAGLARDLYTFLHDRDEWLDSDFATFMAVFLEPRDLDELLFEELLWRQLEKLHEMDRAHHPWAEDVSSRPEDPRFGFSFASTSFFVVGLHQESSRLARRFPYPVLVFNLHEQFEMLRTNERFESMKQTIRERDRALQGSINPMLDDFGERSEARQYSGRNLPDDWRCPVHFADRGAEEEEQEKNPA